ncbi:MAG: VIT domain-containing protein [Armatimonadota bacterium]
MRQFLLCGGLAIVAGTSLGQVGITAGNDGRGERLQQKRLELTADVTGHFAKVKATHIFKSGENWRTELDIIYTLPDGAIPTDFAYYYHGERVPAFITEKERAKEIYKNITTRMQDPALIEFIGKKTFRVRIFPVEYGQDLRMEVCWIQIAKTVKGVPTFEFPIKMRKQDPLSEVSAKVTVARVPWLKRATESIGLKSDSGVFTFDQTAVRPRSDWRFSLLPVAGQKPVTVIDGRSGSEKGYAAVAGNGGPALNSPMTMEVGGTKVTSGTYGPASRLSQEVMPNHPGLKIWAYQRIRSMERSAKNREQVIAMSLRHNLISKFTSWIAIPTEERKRFAQMIKEAKTAVKARKLAEDVLKGRLSEKATKAQYAALRMEILSVAADPAAFESTYLHEPISDSINRRIQAAYDFGSLSKSAQHRKLLETEASVASGVQKLRWLGAEPDQADIGSLDGYEQYLTAEVMGKALKGALDWNFIKKHCPSLSSISEENAAQYAYRVATDALFHNIRMGGLKPTDQPVIERLSKLQKKFNIHQDVDQLDQLSMPGYDAQGNSLPELSSEQRSEMARLANRIGFSTESEFLDVPKYRQLREEGSKLQGQWEQRGRIDTEELVEFRNRVNQLSKRMADDCLNRGIAYAFAPWSNLVIRNKDDFESRVDYIQAYRRRLDEYAKTVPALTKQFKYFAEQVDQETSGDVYYAKNQYIEEYGTIGKSEKYRAEAKQRLIKKLAWLYADEARAQREAEAVTFGSRERLITAYRKRGNLNQQEISSLEKQFLTDPSNQWRGEDYKKDRLQRIKLSVEIEGLEETGASQGRVERLKKELEPIIARMGDPLLSLTLPEDTVSAKAIFPWGEVRDLSLNPKSGEYQVRFDIPPTASEGPGQIVVLSFGYSGVPRVHSAPLTVDMTAPALAISVANGRLVIRDTTKQAVRVKAFGSDGEAIALAARGSFEWVSVGGVEGVEGVRVFAFDGAHNVAQYLGSDVVRSEPGIAKLAKVQTLTHELAGMNIQAVGHWRGIDFAGTLDEGLYYRRPGGQWALLGGLPSQAARQFVPFGNELAIRFGSGDLVLLSEDFTFRSINSQLPRRAALAIASDGKTLAVAQTGGFTLLGDSNSNWFDLPELAGGAPSAISIAKGRVEIGIQGRGFFSVDLSSRGITAMAEPQGLTDDWVTGFGTGVVGTFGGGAYFFRDGKLSAISETSGMQVTGISGNLIATRTGVFMLQDGSVRKLDLEGRDEVQGICKTDQGTLLATRKGVLRIAD